MLFYLKLYDQYIMVAVNNLTHSKKEKPPQQNENFVYLKNNNENYI